MSENKIEIDFLPVAVALLIIFFLGEPDLHDALIKFLMK